MSDPEAQVGADWEAPDARTIPVQRIAPGQHAFAAYGSEAGQWDVVSAFVRQGLALSEKVLVFLRPEISETELLERLDARTPALTQAWSRGQLVLSSMRSLIYPHRTFTAARQWERLTEESGLAVRQGYSSMRAYIDMAWVHDLGTDVGDVMKRERSAGHLFDGQPYSEVCAYDDRAFGHDVLSAMYDAHPVNLLATLGSLRATRGAPRDDGAVSLRLIGEADIATSTQFTRILAAALALAEPRRPLFFDLTSLHFLGAGCAADLLRLCATAAPRTTVRCTPVQQRVLHRLGAGSIRSLALVVEEGAGC